VPRDYREVTGVSITGTNDLNRSLLRTVLQHSPGLVAGKAH